jgi:hypothetical protein
MRARRAREQERRQELLAQRGMGPGRSDRGTSKEQDGAIFGLKLAWVNDFWSEIRLGEQFLV